MSEAEDKELDVSIRFVINPFEIAVNTKAKKSELTSTIIDLVNEIRQKQNELTESVTGIDLTKFKPVGVSAKVSEEPLEKVAEKIGVNAESLRQILRIEGNVPILIAKEKFSSDEKGAMLLIYAYEVGVGRKPSLKEVGAAFKQSGYPLAFGKRSKGTLLKAEKIRIERDQVSLTGDGIADTEAEVRRILPPSK